MILNGLSFPFGKLFRTLLRCLEYIVQDYKHLNLNDNGRYNSNDNNDNNNNNTMTMKYLLLLQKSNKCKLFKKL